MKLTDRTAIVTGASAGLGLATSRQLVDRGARVFGLARRADRLENIQSELGAGFVPIECDISEEKAVETALADIIGAVDSIDVLVNNAGLGRFGELESLSVADWDVQMDTNLKGVFLCTRAVLPVMKKQCRDTGFGGHIVNVASVAGLLGNPRIGAYNATKFGLRGLSESLMKEVRNHGIKVTCIYPGSIETEFFVESGAPMSANPMTADDVASTILHVVEAPDNYLISEVMMRPLRPAG